MGPPPLPGGAPWAAEVVVVTTTQENEPDTVNTVALRGRISSAPTVKELPSGDTLVAFRMSVARPPDPATGGARRSDWFDCTVWGGRVLRSSQTWEVGDVVEITGQLRRRHFRSEGGSQTRVDVVVVAGRRVRRAAT